MRPARKLVESSTVPTNSFGEVTLKTFGNGLRTTRGYDANSGRLTSLQTGTASGFMQAGQTIQRSNEEAADNNLLSARPRNERTRRFRGKAGRPGTKKVEPTSR